MVIRIGTSGWSYDHWHPELYPPGLPARDRLARYAAAFGTAELNSSFYRWPRPAAFRSWRDRLPEGFRLSVKAPRGLTHAGKLDAPEAWLQRIAAGWHELGGKRAVLLVQLPPSLPRDDARLAYFLGLVPGWMRVAVEFRHRSWHCEEIFALLQAHRAAYCVVSGANLPCTLRATTDLVYVRMHGPDHHHLYSGSYPDADLRWWADRIREWDRARHPAGTEVPGRRPGTVPRRDHRLRPGTALSAAGRPRARPSAGAPRPVGARRTGMTPVMPTPRSCGGDMSSPQKCPSTRHYLQTTSDNRRSERCGVSAAGSRRLPRAR